MPLLTSTPDPAEAASDRLDHEARYCLSRYVILRPVESGLVAESLRSGASLSLDNPSRLRLLVVMLTPFRVGKMLAGLPVDAQEGVVGFLEHCYRLQLLVRLEADQESELVAPAPRWELHDLFFHVRSRRGRNRNSVGATYHLWDSMPPEPAFKEVSGKPTIALPHLKTEAEAASGELSLSETLERRRSRYRVTPVDLNTLGRFLARTCRVTSVREIPNLGKAVRKVYPSGGGMHSLEVYAIAERCPDLSRGVYRYRSLDHVLERVSGRTEDVVQLLVEAKMATGDTLPEFPSVLFVFTTRFHRMIRKYQSLAYSAVLKEVGALFQTMYLVGTAMGLAPCAIGSGDSDRFARVIGTDYYRETSVGEFILGGAADDCEP